jgi:hypothetical protein
VLGFVLGGYCGIIRYAGIIVGFFFGFVVSYESLDSSLGLTFGLACVATFWIMYFRIMFYPVHILRGRSLVTFEQNPYLRDGTIWLPIWPVNRKLLLLAKQQPEVAFDFANFLLEYRPLQEKLVIRLLHTAIAEEWSQQALSLNADVLYPPIIPVKFQLSERWFTILPVIPVKFEPSERWLTMLEQIGEHLDTNRIQTQIDFKKDFFEQFVELLKEFRAQTLRESRKWNHYYLDAIDKWIEVATEKSAED